tara:strand:- start:1772 stop:2626 length:855 start_codon:yes stop_codon:yes gene_type:complete
MSNGTTTLPSIGAQLLEVDSRNTTGMFQTPRYNPGPTLGTAGGDVSWIERAGMNVGDAFGGLGGKLGEISDVGKMGMIGGLGNIAAGLIGSGRRKKEQRDAITEYDKMRKAYQNLDTSNIYAGVKNQYANLENTFEDVTINQKQAQFEAQQGAQQRANIMQGLQGAAGGSGIAGLAQAMANQAQQQTQRASASIGQQEATQQRLMAQQAGRIQMAERGGEAQAERLRLSGAESARGLEWQKTGTLLGMAQERKHAADEARAQATQNLTGGIGQVAGSMLTGGIL